MYHFDELINRRNTNSLKWDVVEDGVIPLWVADMDFPVLPELQEALVKRAEHPFYGYKTNLGLIPGKTEGFYEAIRSWYKTRYDLTVETGHLLSGPGTVLSLGMIVREFSREGEGVLLLTPVYTPFFEVVKENRRKVVDVPMEPDEHGRFVLDTAAIEAGLAKAEEAGIKTPLALFCSPHNPGGRVWEREEIAAFLDLARRRNMIVASDEIHGDFVYAKNAAGKPQSFVSAASLESYAERLIVVSGANKTFNLGGLHISHFVIRDAGLRRIMKTALHREASHQGDVFSELAVETVYRQGVPWLTELHTYLGENIREAVQLLNTVPGINAFVPDGTYLIWADVRRLVEKTGSKNDAELVRRLEKEAKVKITAGSIYGDAGAGYVRINTASPRSQLVEGIRRIKAWAG
ncbi:cystathionine beta-lyase [Spirochaetia bacterium]|nr:cystathionine beta-lyase [Spirochaetia bacterium]